MIIENVGSSSVCFLTNSCLAFLEFSDGYFHQWTCWQCLECMSEQPWAHHGPCSRLHVSLNRMAPFALRLEMPYLGWGSNTVLAKFRGQLAIGYPRRPDGKTFQISGGGKTVNNTRLANSVKQTCCLPVLVLSFLWSPWEEFSGWRQRWGKIKEKMESNKALPVSHIWELPRVKTSTWLKAS